MLANPNQFYYPFRPIHSVTVLARMLKLSVAELESLTLRANNLYRLAKREKKSDGRVRECFDAMAPLKSTQARIQCLILKRVRFPQYVTGGISDPDSPRDYVRNAAAHVRAKILVKEDVSNFFPSTSSTVVFDIWHHFFKFPPVVSRVLTALTTKDGGLPQGAKTSSYLANLAFWRTEPALVESLAQLGFRYGRYIDDIAVSCIRTPSSEQLHQAISLISAMVRTSGLRLKRKKHRIMRSDDRMELTGLVVNRQTSLPYTKRHNLRAMVHRAVTDLSNEQLFRSVSARVGQLKRLHPAEGLALQAQLRAG